MEKIPRPDLQGAGQRATAMSPAATSVSGDWCKSVPKLVRGNFGEFEEKVNLDRAVATGQVSQVST